MRIETNAPVSTAAYMLDRDGVPVVIEPTGHYRCQVKRHRDDSVAVLTFETGGGAGKGTIEVIDMAVDEQTVSAFVFEATRDLVKDLAPTAYYADILRTDAPAFEFEFQVNVTKGITDPS